MRPAVSQTGKLPRAAFGPCGSEWGLAGGLPGKGIRKATIDHRAVPSKFSSDRSTKNKQAKQGTSNKQQRNRCFLELYAGSARLAAAIRELHMLAHVQIDNAYGAQYD